MKIKLQTLIYACLPTLLLTMYGLTTIHQKIPPTPEGAEYTWRVPYGIFVICGLVAFFAFIGGKIDSDK